MLYRHVFDKFSTKFHGMFRVLVNYVGFRGFTRISRLHDRTKYQKPWICLSTLDRQNYQSTVGWHVVGHSIDMLASVLADISVDMSADNFHLEYSVLKNRTTFSEVPLLPEIFCWSDPKSQLPLAFQP